MLVEFEHEGRSTIEKRKPKKKGVEFFRMFILVVFEWVNIAQALRNVDQQLCVKLRIRHQGYIKLF